MADRWKITVGCVMLAALMLAGCGIPIARKRPLACHDVELRSIRARRSPQNFGRHSACTLPAVCTDTKAVEAMGNKLCNVLYDQTCRTKGDCSLPLDCLARYSYRSQDIVLRGCQAASDPSCGEEKVLCTCQEVELIPPNGSLACGCDCGSAQ